MKDLLDKHKLRLTVPQLCELLTIAAKEYCYDEAQVRQDLVRYGLITPGGLGLEQTLTEIGHCLIGRVKSQPIPKPTKDITNTKSRSGRVNKTINKTIS